MAVEVTRLSRIDRPAPPRMKLAYYPLFLILVVVPTLALPRPSFPRKRESMSPRRSGGAIGGPEDRGVAAVARQVEQRVEQQRDLGATIAITFSIRGHHSRWRTIWGIARDTGLPEETVRRHIETNPEIYKQSIITLGGTLIYGLRRPAA